MTKVFVYGTLKSGCHNNWLLEYDVLLGEAVSKDEYVLYDGGFPYAVHGSNTYFGKPLPIKGEVWTIDDRTLYDLDNLEGHPNWYRRYKRGFTLLTGEEVEAWVYEYPEERAEPVCETLEVGEKEVYKWQR